MIYLFIATLVMTAIIVSVYMKKVNYNEIKYDEELSQIIEKLDDNTKITEEILKKLNNNHTKVTENLDEKSKLSYYNHKKDTIVMQQCEKKEYARIVNIAHECVHTTQKRSYLVMNKIFSNIQILYFLFLSVYFFYTDNEQLKLILAMVQIFILFITLFAKIVIESDACYRSVMLATDYLEEKIGLEKAKKYREKVEKNIYDMIPMYYINFLTQGVFMAIIVQIIGMVKM